MICLCLTEDSLEKNSSRIAEYHADIDLVELRVDLLDTQYQDWTYLEPWIKEHSQSIPILFTIRLLQDGGEWSEEKTATATTTATKQNPENHRTELLMHAIQSEYVSWVDVEHSFAVTHKNTLAQICTNQNCKLIISQHYFLSESDTSLNNVWAQDILATAEQYPYALVKTALSCNSTAMLCNIFEQCALLHSKIPNRYIVAPMGVFGLVGRILTVHTHSKWTYTSHGDSLAHLGHVSPTVLTQQYKYQYITAHTKLYAVIGNPVLHSKSPEFHNTLFDEKGVLQKQDNNKVYLHLPVDNCSQLKKLASLIPLHGLSVTIPFKQDIIPHLDHIDSKVSQSQSCNTVLIKSTGWHGYNTDIQGFLTPLQKMLHTQNKTLANTRVTVLGAGGTAHAIALALIHAQVQLSIANRTESHAKALVDMLIQHSQQYNLPNPAISYTSIQDYTHIAQHSEIIIQTTSVGMNNTTSTPLPDFPFQGTEIVYDIIYTPPLTKILNEAQKAGCSIISGTKMFETQGLLQSQLFLQDHNI